MSFIPGVRPMKPFLRLCAVALMAFACLRPAAAESLPGAGKTVLMVVRMEGKSLAVDKQIAAHLEARGYAVTLYDQYQPAERAKAFDLVVLSSTVRSRDLLGAYRNVPVPLLTWENDLLDDMAMTGKRKDVDFGMVDKEHYLWMVNAPHPLSAGLPAGVAVGYAKDAPMGWGKPGLGASIIATVSGDPAKAVIFGYEKGATMDYETLAPARRVFFFLDNETFPNLAPAGRKLFDAAIDWASAGGK
ncbi:lipoprotein [Ralstonia solanacearum Po82]|uniref:Lipoprotein n=2 Tax=Ralstonia solanacearum TaxID=305 RepID=F6G3M6_RALS8|nr:lipoprotein [Ralstonia solanacearum Po82]